MASTLIPGSPELTETARYHAEEIPLLGAALLVVPSPWINGYYWLDPGQPDVVEVMPGFDLASDEAENFLTSRTTALLSNRSQDPPLRFPWYDQADLQSNSAWCQLLDAIDMQDELMLRGLGKFHTARQLIGLGFIEEAGVAAFVAVEAALEMIRQHLEQETNTKRTLSDALDYVAKTSAHGSTLKPFLEELNELRVISLHPSSRFGEYWTPPMAVDDVYDLMPELVSLYRHILLDALPQQDAA